MLSLQVTLHYNMGSISNENQSDHNNGKFYVEIFIHYAMTELRLMEHHENFMEHHRNFLKHQRKFMEHLWNFMEHHGNSMEHHGNFKEHHGNCIEHLWNNMGFLGT